MPHESHDDLYEKVGRIEGTLGCLDQKFDDFVVAFAGHRESVETRITKVEADVNRAKGFAAAIGAVFGLVAAEIRSLLNR